MRGIAPLRPVRKRSILGGGKPLEAQSLRSLQRHRRPSAGGRDASAGRPVGRDAGFIQHQEHQLARQTRRPSPPETGLASGGGAADGLGQVRTGSADPGQPVCDRGGQTTEPQTRRRRGRSVPTEEGEAPAPPRGKDPCGRTDLGMTENEYKTRKPASIRRTIISKDDLSKKEANALTFTMGRGRHGPTHGRRAFKTDRQMGVGWGGPAGRHRTGIRGGGQEPADCGHGGFAGRAVGAEGAEEPRPRGRRWGGGGNDTRGKPWKSLSKCNTLFTGTRNPASTDFLPRKDVCALRPLERQRATRLEPDSGSLARQTHKHGSVTRNIRSERVELSPKAGDMMQSRRSSLWRTVALVITLCTKPQPGALEHLLWPNEN